MSTHPSHKLRRTHGDAPDDSADGPPLPVEPDEGPVAPDAPDTPAPLPPA